MKKVTLLLTSLLLACLLQACHSHTDADDAGDTTNDIIDTTKSANIILDKDDIQFVRAVAAACHAEITTGTLAKQKGQDKRVKNFGAMMIRDLTKAQVKVAALAKAKKIALPDSVDIADKKGIDSLTRLSGKDFDNAYIAKTIADHERAIQLFQKAAKYAYDPDIKAFANKHMLPLKRHLDAINAVHDSMK